MLFSCPNLFKNHNNLQLASQATSEVFLALNSVQLYTKSLYFFLNYNAKIKHMRSRKELLNEFIRSQQQWEVTKRDKTVFCFTPPFEILPLQLLCASFAKGRLCFCQNLCSRANRIYLKLGSQYTLPIGFWLNY